MLDIYAGDTARKEIEQNGFNQQMFDVFLGASGGPKWFCLYALDKYIFGQFFNNRSTELNLIGSSAGAFRAACFAQKDPVGAIERLAKNYSQTTYSGKPTATEVSEKVVDLLDVVFAETGAKEIIANPIFKAHFFVAKSNGLVQSENKYIQGLGLINSYLKNRKDRAKLSDQYERFIFQHPTSKLDCRDPDNIPTTNVTLTTENIHRALLASGSIPLVMEGVRDIPGAPKGIYRDGGIIDYHFDLNIKSSGLILYPHFNADPKPGWFDKKTNRQVRAENYDKTVLMCPSPEFIQSLPYGKIPDRKDFTELDNSTRIKYWQTVFDKTQAMADTFDNYLNSNDILKHIKPLAFL